MSLKQLKIFIHELKVGMFVSALDKPWAETPFPIQGFVIKSGADISRVKAYCDYVFVDIEKGISPEDVDSPVIGARLRVDSNKQSADDSGHINSANIGPSKHHLSVGADIKSNLRVKPHVYKKTVELAKEIPAARGAMNNVLGCLTMATRQMARGGAFNQDQLQASVDEMIDSVIRCPDAFIWLLRLRSKDARSHDHSVRSSLWATQFGRHIGLDLGQLRDLCQATLLKDIGRIKLDPALLHNQNRDSDQEVEYRSFVNHSVEQLRSSGFKNRSVINIIKFHCERFDGSGFPKGCAGNRIPMLASVVGIATEFDRLCNSREAGDTMVPSKATSRLYQLRGSAFAENLVVEFIQSVGLYPAGTMVELTTGDQGMVIEQNPRSRLAPRLAVFKNRMDRADQGKYIFIDLKNEQQARERLHRFGQRRAYDVSKLAIVRDIEPDSFGLEYSLLENLIARPFNTRVNELLMGSADSGSQNKGGFLAALKQRFGG
jgi:HD-GYP domain-containing protein (c-di-GMP phosphodiesterase class II)